MTIARKIETAILQLLAANSGVSAIAPDLRHYSDQSSPRGNCAVVAHAEPAQNANLAELAGGIYWQVRLELMAGGRPQNDEAGDRLDALYASVESLLGSITAAIINARLTGDLAGVVVDGIVHEAPDEVNDDEAIGRQYNAILHVHTS